MTDKGNKQLLQYSGMAFEMFATIGLLSYVGSLIDRKLATQPFGIIIFSVIGLVVSFYLVFKRLKNR